MFTTGEFSKIARVSRRLLRHYRDIGLFLPADSDPQSGYNYYSIHQLPALNRILALRDLGFSLEQIQRTVSSDVSTDELRGMLQMRKAEIERSLLDELQKIRSIESRLEVLEQGIPDLEVIIKSIPAQHYLSAQHICINAEHSLQLIGEMQRVLPAQVGSKNLGEMITMLHSEDFRVEDAPIEIGYILPKSKSFDPIELKDLDLIFAPRTLEAVETMATVAITQNPDFWHQGTTAIGHWMDTHGYKMNGSQREVWYSNPSSSAEELMVELQIPVIRRIETPQSLLNN